MAKGYIATKANVEQFLEELKIILNSPKSQLNIIPRQDKKAEYSTEYCLRSLKFTSQNIKEEYVISFC